MPLQNKVLIIDDNTSSRSGLNDYLSGEHYQMVVDTPSFSHGFSLAQIINPDIVIADFNTPGFNRSANSGLFLEFAKKYRVLFYSDSLGVDPEYIARRTVSLGAKGFVSKGEELPEVKKAIEEIINTGFYMSPMFREFASKLIVEKYQKPANGTVKLTPRELEVLDLITGEELNNKGIANILGVGVRTVETHRERIMRKLDIHTVAGLTRYAISEGRIKLSSDLEKEDLVK